MKLNEMIEDVLNLSRERGYDDLRQKLLLIKDEIANYSNTLDKEQSSFMKVYPIKKNMRYQKNVGYFVILDDGSEDGPYCPDCWETKGKLIHLKEDLCKNWSSYNLTCNENYYDHYYCSNHKYGYELKNYNIEDTVKQELDERKRELSKEGEQND